ncbi:MAG: hypothetical protein JWM57_3087, partial [Phycisphaerales bacterium]|nr:hypothetical protein [Phycisphaerales bacterium]
MSPLRRRAAFAVGRGRVIWPFLRPRHFVAVEEATGEVGDEGVPAFVAAFVDVGEAVAVFAGEGGER